MPSTIKSLCDAAIDRLCSLPVQDFAAAAVIRNMQQSMDPHGRKTLSPNQVRTTKAFLRVLVKTAYR